MKPYWEKTFLDWIRISLFQAIDLENRLNKTGNVCLLACHMQFPAKVQNDHASKACTKVLQFCTTPSWFLIILYNCIGILYWAGNYMWAKLRSLKISFFFFVFFLGGTSQIFIFPDFFSGFFQIFPGYSLNLQISS